MRSKITLSLLIVSVVLISLYFFGTKALSPVMNSVQTANAEVDAHPDWEDQWFEMRKNEQGEIPYDKIRQIRSDQFKVKRSSGHLMDIKELGPYNVGGRTRAIIVDHSNKNHLITGGVSGGIWRSTDRGQTWNVVDDFAATLSVTDITQNPFNADIIYYSTGEVNGNSAGVVGDGIFKSIDRGLTFQQLPASTISAFTKTHRIRCSPTDSNTLYVATASNGLYRSTDGGASFTQVFVKSLHDITDIELFKDGSIIVGVRTQGIYYSPNGDPGTFVEQTNGLPSSGFRRVEIAYCDSLPNVMYAALENSAGNNLLNVYKTTNSGASWSTITNPTTANISFGIAYYCLSLAVKPNDPDMVIIGSVQMGYTTNGGNTWKRTINTHFDNHQILFDPFSDNEVYITNDGGIYRQNISTLASAFEDLNQGYNVTQFYTGSFFPTGDGIVGGAQDNGTQLSVTGDPFYKQVVGGDGGYCHIDQNDPTVGYFSLQKGIIYRGNDLNTPTVALKYIVGELDADNNINIDDGAWFINPFELNPTDGKQLYFPTTKRLWRSLNSGDNWEPITAVLPSGFQSLYGLAVTAEQDPTIYLGGSQGIFYRIENAAGTSPVTVDLKSSVPPQVKSGFISSIKIHPQYDSVIYVSYSNYIAGPKLYKVHNAMSGSPVWTDISTNIPSGMPVNWVEVNAYDDQNIFIATDFGLFSTLDGGASWVKEAGIPNVSVHMLRLRKSDNRLFIYTHGRGIWSAQLSGGPNTSVTEKNNNERYTLFPNPTEERFKVEGQHDLVEIYNIVGQKVLSLSSYEGNELNISSFKRGNYIVRIIDKNKVRHSGSITKL